MNLVKYIVLLAAITLAKEPVPEPQDDLITPLTHANFQKYINSHKFVVVNFYIENCATCEEFVPVFKTLANRLKKEKIKFTSVNLTQEKALNSRVKGLKRPIVKIYIYGVHVIYSGPLVEDSMFNFLILTTHNHTEELYDADDINDFIDRERSLIFFLPEDDRRSLSIFDSISAAYRHIPFRYSFDTAIKDKYGNGKYVLIFFRNYNEGHKIINFEEPLTPELLKSFIDSHYLHFVIDMNKELDHHIVGPDSASMVYFSDTFDEPEYAVFEHFAKSKKHTFSFMRAHLTKDIGAHVADMIGVKPSESPVVYIIYGDAVSFKKSYVGEITYENLTNAIKSFKSDGIIKYVKSQHAVDNSDNVVKIVVAENFDELVVENNKVVLVYAYSPWCDICKGYERIYDELGDLMKDQSDIVIAKIDATLNDHRLLDVNTHPTILLFVPGSKEHPKHYYGVQKLEFLVKELEKAVVRDLPQPRDAVSDEL